MVARRSRKAPARKETKKEREQREEIARLRRELAKEKAKRNKPSKTLKKKISSREKRKRAERAAERETAQLRKAQERQEKRREKEILRASSYEKVAERLDLETIDARREEKGFAPLPKSKLKNGTTTLSFSDKAKGSWRGGGQTAIDFPSSSPAQLQRASRLLRRLKDKLQAWQVSRSWVITYSQGGRSRRRAEIGFSPWRSRRETSPGAIQKALGDSAAHAAKGAGLDLAYEGKVPKNIKSDPRDRSFRLYIWWKAKNRRFFVEEE